MPGWAYILTSKSGTLYTGSTDHLHRRILEHRSGVHSRFASKYGCNRLVWFQEFATPQPAMVREAEIKAWTRAKKIALIESTNPEWRDLAQHWEYPVLATENRIADQA